MANTRIQKEFLDDELATQGMTNNIISESSSPYTMIEEMENDWVDWYANGTTSIDTIIFNTGVASIKVITGTNGSFSGMRKNITDINLSNSSFRFFIRCTNWSQVLTANILLSTNGLFVDFFSFNVKQRLVSPADNEWLEVICTQSDWAVGAGTPNWHTVNDMIFRCTNTPGTTPTLHLDSFIAYPVKTKGRLSIVCDDGWVSQFTEMKKKMDTYRMVGTAYVIWNQIGIGSFMNQSQISNLSKIGWEIAGHGGTNLTTFTPAQVTNDLSNMRNYLNIHGYSDNYSLPNGASNENILANVYKYFKTARNIDSITQSPEFIQKRLNAFSPNNLTPVADLNALVDRAIANNDWVIITFHEIVTTPTVETQYSIANFGSFIDYVNTSGIDVMTVNEAILMGNRTRQIPTIKTVTTAYTARTQDDTILVNATGGAVTVMLPPVATNSGKILNVKKIDASANVVTIDGNAAETIDGTATKTTTVQWFNFQIQSNGVSWVVL